MVYRDLLQDDGHIDWAQHYAHCSDTTDFVKTRIETDQQTRILSKIYGKDIRWRLGPPSSIFVKKTRERVDFKMLSVGSLLWPLEGISVIHGMQRSSEFIIDFFEKLWQFQNSSIIFSPAHFSNS